MSTKKTTPKKRKRKDTFHQMTADQICKKIEEILKGDHAIYSLDKSYTCKDAKGEIKTCWKLLSKNTVGEVYNIFSVAAYRPFYTWWVYVKKGDTPDNLALVSKTGYHHAHRCHNEWCVNPEHIRIEKRTENEADKHWHYFLKGEKRDGFIKLYREELIKRNVW